MYVGLSRKLIELDLLERLAGEVLTSLIHKRIENHVQETCKGSFDTSHITSLENVSSLVQCFRLNNFYFLTILDYLVLLRSVQICF